MGALRDGADKRRDFFCRATVGIALSAVSLSVLSRPHATTPAKQSCSRSAGSYCSTRAGRICCSQAGAGSSSPCNCSITCKTPSRPRSWVPGATCCQASRKFMKSAAATGSISLRKRPSVKRWMRASNTRSHHSSPLARAAWAVNWPRITTPALSSAINAALILPVEIPKRALRPSTVTGPLTSSQPWTISLTASSAVAADS